MENDQSISANNNDDLLNETSPEADLPKQTDMQKVERPKMLRKLSEVLPQCPDPSLPDSTHLPDRIVRLWAAELVQVIFLLFLINTLGFVFDSSKTIIMSGANSTNGSLLMKYPLCAS